MWTAAEAPEWDGGAWEGYGPPLEVLKTQVDGFFRYKANGVGGETQKRRSRLCLDVFQILKSRADWVIWGLIFGVLGPP